MREPQRDLGGYWSNGAGGGTVGGRGVIRVLSKISLVRKLYWPLQRLVKTGKRIVLIKLKKPRSSACVAEAEMGLIVEMCGDPELYLKALQD